MSPPLSQLRLAVNAFKARVCLSKRSISTFLPLVQSASNLLLSNGGHGQFYGVPEPVYRVRTRTADGSKEEKMAMEEIVVPFFVSDPASASSRPVGFLRSQVLRELQAHAQSSDRSPWSFHHTPSRSGGEPWAASFASWVNNGGSKSRSSIMNDLLMGWKDSGVFPLLVRGWNNEQYPVYHPEPDHLGPPLEGPVAFSVERAALPLFGFANYGCFLTAYFKSPETDEIMVWIPRRSRLRKNFPGALDVTVGGGMGMGDTALSTIIRESAEEASLDADYVRAHVRSVGLLSYPNRSPDGWLLPGLYYLFELPLRPDGTPRPAVNETDGEVEAFGLMSVTEVRKALLRGGFKPSSALALVDFLIRHGCVTEANDERFAQVCMMLRRQLGLPIPWRG